MFTCIACRVGFMSAEAQREHYRTTWHRYNLQRKAVSLPCVSLAVFRSRQAAAEAQAAQAALDAAFTGECKVCRKTYASSAALEQHLGSKKHKVKAAKAKEREEAAAAAAEGKAKEDEDEEGDEEEGVVAMETGDGGERKKGRKWEGARPVGPEDEEEVHGFVELYASTFAGGLEEDLVATLKELAMAQGEILSDDACLFCEHLEEDVEERVAHMREAHGFSIPDGSFVCDLEGLLRHLSRKISLFCSCVQCDVGGKPFSSVRAAQQHMRDLHHTRFPYTGVEVEYEAFYDYDTPWLVEQLAKMGLPADTPLEELSEEQMAILNAPVEAVDYNPDTMELILPSGRSLGHRSLKRYYNQKPIREHTSEALQTTRSATAQRLLGWHGGNWDDNKAKGDGTAQARYQRLIFESQVGESANNKKHFRLQYNM